MQVDKRGQHTQNEHEGARRGQRRRGRVIIGSRWDGRSSRGTRGRDIHTSGKGGCAGSAVSRVAGMGAGSGFNSGWRSGGGRRSGRGRGRVRLRGRGGGGGRGRFVSAAADIELVGVIDLITLFYFESVVIVIDKGGCRDPCEGTILAGGCRLSENIVLEC